MLELRLFLYLALLIVASLAFAQMVVSTGEAAMSARNVESAHVGVAASHVRSDYDIVLRGGRVIDPETRFDAVRDVGIIDGQITAISEEELEGQEVLDVSGLVVAPGFIDLHAHGQDEFSSGLQAQDGVTTALEMEGGAFPVDPWYEERAGSARIHYGATVGWHSARTNILGDIEDSLYEPLSDAQLDELEEVLRRELDRGALGIAYGIQYVPGARREEVYRAFRVAADHDVANFVHVRYAGHVEPESSVAAIQEVLANSAATGAPMHIVHINSTGLDDVPLLLDMIEGARARGVDVTTEVYPYTAASTGIESAIFDPSWRERFRADYSDIEWVATGERLDSLSFYEYREEGGIIIAHIIPEEAVETALAHPGVIVASDGVPFVDGRAHPRGAGTFARVLGHYVRERGVLTLMEALEKMTLLPAQRLEDALPAMQHKGRVQEGADADLTIFDPDRVIDRATFEEPTTPSEGIEHVLVGGTFVVRDGELIEDTRPGKPIRRTVKEGVPAGGR